jgi:hypothetical protein
MGEAKAHRMTVIREATLLPGIPMQAPQYAVFVRYPKGSLP